MNRQRERGASAVEYGLLIAAIAAILTGVVFSLGTVVSSEFASHTSCLASKMNSQAC